jgi:hypothetical protein
VVRCAAVSIALALVACDDDEPEVATLPVLPDAGAVPDASAASGADAVVTPDTCGAALDAGTAGFRCDVYPLFVEYCGECHSVNGPYHDIASPDLSEAYADAVEYAPRIVARIEQGSMPPQCVFDDSACVPAEALEAIERWIASGMPE